MFSEKLVDLCFGQKICWAEYSITETIKELCAKNYEYSSNSSCKVDKLFNYEHVLFDRLNGVIYIFLFVNFI